MGGISRDCDGGGLGWVGGDRILGFRVTGLTAPGFGVGGRDGAGEADVGWRLEGCASVT